MYIFNMPFKISINANTLKRNAVKVLSNIFMNTLDVNS